MCVSQPGNRWTYAKEKVGLALIAQGMCLISVYMCIWTHAHTHTLTHCICCCLGGMGLQGDLRRGEQLCCGSDVPLGCGSSHWQQHSRAGTCVGCLSVSLWVWRCRLMVLPVRLKDKVIFFIFLLLTVTLKPTMNRSYRHICIAKTWNSLLARNY